MHLTAGFVISNVVFVHDYGNGHQLTKDVDMVTLQRRLLFEKGGGKLEQPGILHVRHRPPMWL